VSAAETIEEVLLPACVVRIDVDGRQRGSGFFVAPGLVATCSFVIGGRSDSPSGAGDVVVVAKGDSLRALPSRVSEERDLALLEVEPSADQLCVLIDPELRPRDPLHAFGYTENYPGGVPTTLEAEGMIGGDRRL
jgi:Trypsin-like peptidase domain